MPPATRGFMDLNAKVRQVLLNVTCHGDFGILRALLLPVDAVGVMERRTVKARRLVAGGLRVSSKTALVKRRRQ
jgi:hypothetical protein